jgi:hypothetical protein
MNINSSNFRKIGRSVNTAGGLQFTYQFWIKISADTTANDIKDRIILHRGSQQKFSSGIYKYDSASKTYNKIEEKPSDIVIKCPLIKFGQSKDEIEVIFNTQNDPNLKITMSSNNGTSSTGRRNMLSLLPLNWYLMTFVFQDNVDATEKVNGISFKFWLNDVQYYDVNASNESKLKLNFIKENFGDLFVCPSGTSSDNKPVNFDTSKVSIGNMKYFNYAVQTEEITGTFLKGPPKHTLETYNKTDVPSFLSTYNKLDIYNM